MLYTVLKKYLLLLLSLFTLQSAGAQFYNGSNLTFGKNRVQYQEFFWQYYRFEKFDTYFYEGGNDLASYVSEVAPMHIRDMENKLDHVMQESIEFIVYNSQSDFKQSNLGLLTAEGNAEIGGTAKIVGTKVFLFYEGDHDALERQIREGICRVLIQDMLYGGDWKDVVKNSALLNLPEWYMEGLVSYMVEDWTPELRDRVRDGILSGRYKKFNRLTRDESKQAGYSVWRYIGEVYGASVIPNVLYMTMVSRNVESGFIFVLGISMDELMKEHQFYYQNFFAQQDVGKDSESMEELYIKTKKTRSYSQFELSPDGKKAVFVSNELGQYRIHLFNVEEHRLEEAVRRKKYEQKQKEFEAKEKVKKLKDEKYIPKMFNPYKPKMVRARKIFKAEHKLDRLADDSYPVIEWSPSGDEVAFITEKRGALFLNIYSLEKKKNFPREIYGLDKVLSFDYSPNGRQMVFSGVTQGRTDLYLYYLIGNRQEQLTNDSFDDLEPRFAKDSKAVIFVSDRKSDSLYVASNRLDRNKNRDVFVMDLANRSVLERITNTKNIDERTPFAYNQGKYTYLAAKEGVYDRYVARYDSVISRIDTTVHYRYFTETQRLSHTKVSPLEYDVNAQDDYFSYLTFEKGRYRFMVEFDGLYSNGSSTAIPSLIQEQTEFSQDALPPLPILVRSELLPPEVNIRDFDFSGAKPKPEKERDPEPSNKPLIIDNLTEILAIQSGTSSVLNTTLPKPRNYKLNFATDQVQTQFTNSFNQEFYQSAYGAEVLSPGLSPALQWGMSDLFEDRRITASLLIAGGISNIGYGIRYDNLTKRLDKSVIFTRQTNNLQDANFGFLIRTNQHVLRYKTSYPINEVLAIKADLAANHERIVILGDNDISLDFPNLNNYTAGAKLELVFDNTLSKGLNLYNGSRVKIWGEYYREYVEIDKSFPDFMVFGADFRHYQKIHRDIIMAFRIAGNTSFGQNKLLNFLGGVDNWILPRPSYDNSVAIDYDQNYRYQALISPMRGFYRNARNGTSAAVASAELRFPVFRYLLNKPIQSDFVQHFQVVGFADVGSAWTGPHPYSDENTFNQIEIDGNPISIVLQNQENPVIEGYGFGMRSKLLGYFVRADWAWGVIDGRVLPYEFYLSLNLDF